MKVEYADALIEPLKAAIVAALDPAPNDAVVQLPGGFRAVKVSREHGGATYLGEVRIFGVGFDHRNDIACGITWAAERIAVAHLDASASGEGSAA